MSTLADSSSINCILARFRPDSGYTAPPLPAPVGGAMEPSDVSPSQQRDLVRYEPPPQRGTRSQVSRLAKADEGDLQARLELVTVKAAEETLAARFCKHEPERSILSYLQQPGDGVAPHEAASAVLEELADQTEGTALDCVMVFRYIQAYVMWKGHPNPDIRSAEDLIRSLDGGDYVQANIIIGTSAQMTKRHCIRLISGAWGEGWFENIPREIRNPAWSRPEDCSKRMLTQIAANAKQDMAMVTAIEGWSSALQQRNDYGARQRLGIRSRTTPYILPTDVASMNQKYREGRRWGRTSELFSAEEAKEDRLRVEVVPLPSVSKSGPAKRNCKESIQPRVSTKRRRMRSEEQATADDSSTTEYPEPRDGSKLAKRLKNHLVRKPVADVRQTDSSSPHPIPSERTTDQQGQAASPEGTQSSGLSSVREEGPHFPSQPKARSQVCGGHGFALGVRKMLEMFEDLEDPTYAKSRCCDKCFEMTMAAVNCLRRDLRDTVASLHGMEDSCLGMKEMATPHGRTGSDTRTPRWPDELLSNQSDDE